MSLCCRACGLEVYEAHGKTADSALGYEKLPSHGSNQHLDEDTKLTTRHVHGCLVPVLDAVGEVPRGARGMAHRAAEVHAGSASGPRSRRFQEISDPQPENERKR